IWLAKRLFWPRALIAYCVLSKRATCRLGARRSASGIVVAPERRISSAVMTKSDAGTATSRSSRFEADVTTICESCSRLSSVRSRSAALTASERLSAEIAPIPAAIDPLFIVAAPCGWRRSTSPPPLDGPPAVRFSAALLLADRFVDRARFGRRLDLEPGERLAAAVERLQGLGAAFLALIAEHQAAVETLRERIRLEAALVAGESAVEFAALFPEPTDVSHGSR